MATTSSAFATGRLKESPAASSTGVTGNVDAADLSRFLQTLESAIVDCQTQIGVAINATTPDHLKCCNAVDSLAADVDAIKSDISRLETAISTPPGALARVSSIDPEVTTVSQRLAGLQRVADVLDAVLNIRALLIQFDNALYCAHLDIASDAVQNASAVLSRITPYLAREAKPGSGEAPTTTSADVSATTSNVTCEEDDMYLLHYLKSQVTHRRSQLGHLVCIRLDALIKFFPHGVEVSLTSPATDSTVSPLTLEQLWHALKGTPSLKEKLTDVVTALIETVIDPVAKNAFSIPRGRIVTSRTLTTGGGGLRGSGAPDSVPESATAPVGSLQQQQPRNLNEPSSAVWTWLEAPADNAPTDYQTLSDVVRPIFLLLDVLESLFDFVAKHFFPGHPDLLEQLGTALWPDLTAFLKESVGEKEMDGAVLDRLRDFETKLKALYVIPFDSKILTTFCNRHEKVVFDARRRQILCDVRRLCTAVDPAVVVVGEDAQDDPLLMNLEATLKVLQRDDPANTKLVQYLEESPLLLPKCYVSRGAYETVAMIERLLTEVLERIREKGLDDDLLTPTIETIRDAVSFFVLLRSSLNRDKLYKDALYAAVFYCDLLFISRRMLLLLPSVEKQIPRVIQTRQHQFALLDLVNTMRPVQEEVFNNMLVHHRDRLLELCLSLGSVTQLSLDQEYMAAEARIAEIVQYLKTLVVCWTDVLPADLTARCFARLLDVFITTLLAQICEQVEEPTRLSLPNANALSFLLASTRDQLLPILHSVANENVESYTETWSAFCLFKELIDADVPQFIARKREIRDRLSLQQVQTVLAINGRKTLSAAEILELLVTGKEV